MKARKIKDGIFWMGAIDWDRRLFDSLIPLPDGTSYNSYLVEGNDKTVLIDTVDPSMAYELMNKLIDVPKIDHIIIQHAEQDHSGSLPLVLEKYRDADVLVTPAGKGTLIDLLNIPEERITTVNDGSILPLGGRTLRFVHTPWVHWPETMVTYIEEEGIFFTCDLFGAHMATTDLFVIDERAAYESTKRYYAEIMMPFRKLVRNNIEKLQPYPINMIAPSHGPIYDRPDFIIEAHRDWVSDIPGNSVVLPYASMHGSTQIMVRHLVSALVERDVRVHQFNLPVTDLGKLAISMVDAATLCLGTPTVHFGPHPSVIYAASIINALRPKLKFVSLIGSYGWRSRAIEHVTSLIPNLMVEVLTPVIARGLPKADDLKALDDLADLIAQRHEREGLI